MKQVILYILLAMCCIKAGAQTNVPALPESRHPFIVIAHRGDHVEVPENTLAAFEHAIKNEVDYVEIDLRTTKDSVLVIMHDATVDRMTNAKGRISTLTYAEVQLLQVRDKAKDSTKTYPVPTFEEVLKTCRDKIHIYLDFKDASVQQSYNMIKQYGMQNQVIVYINSPAQYNDWRRIAPAMPLMVSLPGTIKTAEALTTFLTTNPVALLDGDYSDYTPEMVQAAATAGIPAWPDIQSPNEAINWDKALQLGFKGLQTDHPAALIAYLKSKGLR